MTNWHSEAIDLALNALDQYSEDVDIRREVPEAVALLSAIRTSTAQLYFSESLLALERRHASPDTFTAWLNTLVATEAGREYLAVGFARDGLRRAEGAVERVPDLVAILRGASPPERSIKYLQRVGVAYLHGFDLECIAFCRAVVEVLVEEFVAPNEVTSQLGQAIRRLRDEGVGDRRLTRRQAADMFFINEQAKEVLHDEPSSRSLDPLGCIERLARILTELHHIHPI